MASMASIAAELDTLPFSAQTSGSFPAGPPTDSSSHVASFTSTPPTTVSPDSMSLASEPDHAKSDDPIGGAHDIPLSLSLTNLGPLFEAAFPSLERAIEHQRDQLLAEEATPRPTPRPSPYLSPGVELDISSPLAPAIVVADDALPRPANENQGTDCHPAAPASSSRPRRARASLPVYNLALLSGIDAQKKRCAKGDINGSKRRKTLSSDMLASGNEADAHLLDETQDKPNRASRIDVDARLHGTPQSARKVRKEQAPPATITRRATRQSSSAPERLDTKLSSMGKRVRKTLEKGVTQVPRELKRLQDTKEYAHIDTVPVRYTVWSNGKYVDPKELEAKKKAEEEAKKERNPEAGALPASHSNKNDDDTVGAASGSQDAVPPHNNVAGDVDAAQAKKSRPVKKWLDKGLYAGQAFPDDISKGLTIPEKKSLAQHPELHQKPGVPVNKALPPPMFNGLRLLLHGRDFKLPFDICNPLPPGQPKPTQYRTITKSKSVMPKVSPTVT